MREPIAVVTSDTHLSPRAWLKHPGICGDSYYSFAQITDYCIRHELPLILAGDVFDKQRPDPTTVYETNKQLNTLAAANLSVLFVQGQHELDRALPWLNAINLSPIHIDRRSYVLDGINLYGIDWQPGDVIGGILDAVPENTDVVIAHQVWKDLMGNRSGDCECRFCDVPHARMLITGDFHSHLLLACTNKQANPMTVLSPGPICMQSIDEDPNKEFFVLYDDLSVDNIKLKTRNCYRFVINTEEELEIFLLGNLSMICTPQLDVPSNIAKNMVNITYSDDIPEVYKRLTVGIGNSAHLFLAPLRVNKEEVSVEVEARRKLADGGMEACLELITPKEGKIYKDVLSLLRSTDPRTQLEEMHQRFLDTFR
jgi:hypothetical protein